MKKFVLFQVLSFCKWYLKFSIFFTFMIVITCKKKQTLKFWKPWIWRKTFCFFLVLKRDRNNFETKLSLSRHRNLIFSKFKIFVGICDLKSWRSQERSDMQRLFWNDWIFNTKKFIFKVHLRREITTKSKILENMFRLSFWKYFYLELVSLNMAFWRLYFAKYFSWRSWL